MALKRLSTGEMVSLTHSLVTPGHPERLAMERIPVLAALLPYVDQVHGGLLASQSNPELERLSGISGEEKDVDALHDALARGIWHALEAHKYLVRDVQRAAEIGRMQNSLFPQALKVVQFSYRETAGQGRLLASRLTEEHKALLASIPVDGGTLLDAVQAWLDAAAALGTLENERTRIMGETVAPSTVRRARNQWIRAINAVRGLVVGMVGMDDPVLARVIQRITDVEAVADRRLQGGGSATPAPGTGDTDEAAGNGADEDQGDDADDEVDEATDSADRGVTGNTSGKEDDSQGADESAA